MRANINGPMVVSTAARGSTIKWKDKALLLGVMADDMLAAIRMIRSTATEPLNGQMVESILVNGAKVNNMEKVFTSKKARKGRVFGKWARGLSGLRHQPSKQQMEPRKNDEGQNVYIY